ncbi:MAG: biopolymer transporter ExbD [Bacteroidales bacterium]|nr:biopolymer transporter ExbD [Bacteroidales bacterium]
MSKRKAPEINAGSMADIAFLLLIFFLVTTTMNVNTGITRILPPPVKKQDTKVDVNKRNVMQILVNSHDFLLVNGKPGDLSTLANAVEDFMTVHGGDNPNYPETKEEYFPELGQKILMTKGIVSLKNDRGTSYDMYIKVQDQLAKAFADMKNQASLKYFGVKYKDLIDKKKVDLIDKLVPVRISEAEPENVGGNN